MIEHGGRRSDERGGWKTEQEGDEHLCGGGDGGESEGDQGREGLVTGTC